MGLGVVDDIVEEPLGGAHRDHHQMAGRIKMFLIKTLRELCAIPTDQLVEQRYQKFLAMGAFPQHPEHPSASERTVDS